MMDANWTQIIIAGFAVISTLGTGVIGLFTILLNRKQGVIATKVDHIPELAKSAEKIHDAVNSERTATMAVITELRNQITQLARDNAVLQEKIGGKPNG